MVREMREKGFRTLGNEVMDRLQTYVGKRVVVTYVHYGMVDVSDGVLKFVNAFVNLQVGSIGIPFVGTAAAIQTIISSRGELLYDNPVISDRYLLIQDDHIYLMKRISFGGRRFPFKKGRR